jgi:hypothetical protein
VTDTFDIGAFRTAFPEFASPVTYPDAMLSLWTGLVVRQVRSCIWKDSVTLGRSLYLAHVVTIEAQNQKAASQGGVPGTSGGIANSKTVGSVTVSYDSVTSSEKDAGWWNRTTYGQQFYRLVRIFGAGVIQL